MNEFGMDLLWLILLVLLYGFFTLGKTALVALNDRKLEKQAETDGTAKRLVRLLSEPGRFLTVAPTLWPLRRTLLWRRSSSWWPGRAIPGSPFM